ncbi:Pollen Ole e 1 allergen/extensin [Cinnamomum micranthum f. kanehirae]|uniref:Pollen Ole e 1 allergen/extensin n=1 Tax=Cinnamomum micranthum f. kanehirae TaxID=337451 RepID=A0A443N2W0_9MAGN|nr:Pollen Ole e 1 allergen/extensin [Cinnamomum micranthum f. kanehirae]
MRITFLLILAISFFHSCAAKHEKLPSAMVVGTVYCETCFHQQFSKASHFISGASVEVECGDLRNKTGFLKKVKTNKHGQFKVHLPFSVSKHIKKIKKCSVKLISSSEPFCAVASLATSSSLHLKSRKQGIHIFSAGIFTFKPLQQPDLCYEKPSLKTSSLSPMKTFRPYPNIPQFPPLNQSPPPPMVNLPPLPKLPLLPPLPTVPHLPNLGPVPKQPSKTTIAVSSSHMPSFHEEPAQQKLLDPKPPALEIPSPPNPLQVTPPFINPPPIPIITNPEPALPLPLPPISFPLQPPAFPGIPPSKKTSP